MPSPPASSSRRRSSMWRRRLRGFCPGPRRSRRGCRVDWLRATGSVSVRLFAPAFGCLVRAGVSCSAAACRLHPALCDRGARLHAAARRVGDRAGLLAVSRQRPSRLAPVGLALSVATALLLHVWAILLPFALVVGEAVELVRSAAHPLARRRCVDRGRAGARDLSDPAARVEHGRLRRVRRTSPRSTNSIRRGGATCRARASSRRCSWPSLSRRGGRAGARAIRRSRRLGWTPPKWRRLSRC